MEHSGFFDAAISGGVYDRAYNASDFARYFSSFIGNGVFAQSLSKLQVVEKSVQAMSVLVKSGQAWINGYWYENSDDMSLTIDAADGVLNRIDSIVIRKGILERSIYLAVKKGTPAVSAIAPTVARTADYYELKLADVYVNAGITKVKQENIVDKRMDSTVCGYVTGMIDQLDTTDFSSQIQSFIDNLKVSSLEDVQEMLDQLNEVLNGDVSGNIIKRLNDLENIKYLTLTAAGWTGTVAPFTQTVSLVGVKSYMTATLVGNMQAGLSVTARKEYLKNYGIISMGYAEINDDSVTFTVDKKPSSDISVGLKGITGVTDIIVDSSSALFNMYDNFAPVDYKRNIVRGYNLGTSISEVQKTNIRNGTFKGMFVGDYWVMGGKTWRIVDINYWLNTGDTTKLVKPHLVIMPDQALYGSAMNQTNTTSGGYVGSSMYTTGLDAAKSTIQGLFADTLLTRRNILTTSVGSDGIPNASAWVDVTVEIPSEVMLTGCNTVSGKINCSYLDCAQLQFMRMNQNNALVKGSAYWLRDVVNTTMFAMISSLGMVAPYNASTSSISVRPVFAIG